MILTLGHMAQYAAEALESLQKQSLREREIELLFADSGETPGAAELFQKYGKNRANWRQLSLPGASLAIRRNTAIEQARGKYVTFLDGKDRFTRHYLEALTDAAEKNAADLTVGRMRGFDVFGSYIFTSTHALSIQKLTNRFDTSLLWNPSVSNKLFLREKLLWEKLRFSELSSAQDALFCMLFALHCKKIASSARGFSEFRNEPFYAKKGNEESLHNYLYAYAQIRETAKGAFEKAIAAAGTDFSRLELEKVRDFYLDEVYSKALTVLLYRFYRNFHEYDDAMLESTVQTVEQLLDALSPPGQLSFLRANADIFQNGKLPRSHTQAAAAPRVSIALCGERTPQELNAQLDSLFAQSLPFFELLVEEHLLAFLPETVKMCVHVRPLRGEGAASLYNQAMEEAQTPFLLLLDEPCILGVKALQEHVNTLLAQNEIGFTASPLAQYDGKQFAQYKTAALAFRANRDAQRSEKSPGFVLDLFLCNKVFRLSHLTGIKFAFSENTVLDVYKLYEHSTFRKLPLTGIYLPLAERDAVQRLRAQEQLLPRECAAYYKTYLTKYRREVGRAEKTDALIAQLKKYKRFFLERANHSFQWLFRRMPLRDTLLFFTIRSDGVLTENLADLYTRLPGKKKIVAATLPHPLHKKPSFYYQLMTAKIIITDDYVRYLRAFQLRESQRVLQVWHACGAFKRFSLDAPLPRTRLEELKTHSQYSLVCVSSEHCRQFYAHAFGIDPAVVQPVGIPRTDALSNPAQREQMRARMHKKHSVLKGKTVYLYCPTFREKEGERVPFEPGIDWKKLNTALRRDEIFIINKHPVMQEDYLRGKHYMQLRDYSKEPTPELLAVCDVLITDYSSVFYDACLMGIPTVFYCPDLQGFERVFYLRYPEDLPGPAVTDAEELLPCLHETLENPPLAEIEAFTKVQLGNCDGRSTERVCAIVEHWRNEL